MDSTSLKKRIFSLSICLFAALTLIGCSSQSRDPAEEQARVDSVSKAHDEDHTPHKVFNRRFAPRSDKY